MLLSIAMIMKNEAQNLIKSLPALDKLRKEISTELIILDTGSTDNSIEIAKQYTDKVYEAKWNNNFADMRNKSFSYATGEWLLVIDADEELVDCENLIDFFKTDKHTLYNSAVVTLNNFTNEDFSESNMLSLIRMFRRKNFKYEGAIHEQPIYKKPIYNPINGIANFNHYGYIFEDEEFRIQKMKRNEKILLEELKKNPNDEYINFQLGVNFNILGCIEESKYYLNKSLNIYNSKGALYYPVYSTLIELLFNNKEYARCKEVCLKYLKKEKTNIDIYFVLGEIYRAENNFTESINCYEKYLYYFENYHLSRQSKDITCSFKTSGFKTLAMKHLINLKFDTDKLEDCMNLINNLKNNNPKDLIDCYDTVIKLAYKSNNSNLLVKFYTDLNSNIERTNYIVSLEKYISKLTKEDSIILFEQLALLEDDYGKLNKLRLSSNINIDEAKLLLEKNNTDSYSDIIRLFLNNNLDIMNLLKDLSYFKVNNLISFAINNYSISNDLYNYLLGSKLSFDKNSNMIISIIAENLIKTNKISASKKSKVFPIFTESRYRYIKDIYNTNLDESIISHYLNSYNDMFVIEYMNCKKINKSNYLDIIKSMNKLSKDFPEFAKFLISEVDKIKSNLNIPDNFITLSKEYKSIIKNEVAKGNIDVAIQLIKDLESVTNYEDYEILGIKAIIEIQLKNYDKAHLLIKESYLLNPQDLDTVFNLGYLYLNELNFYEALTCFNKITNESNDTDLVNDAIYYINNINN